VSKSVKRSALFVLYAFFALQLLYEEHPISGRTMKSSKMQYNYEMNAKVGCINVPSKGKSINDGTEGTKCFGPTFVQKSLTM